MEKWEHEIYHCNELIQLEQLIRPSGKEGWQLVSVVQNQLTGEWTAFLKRRVSYRKDGWVKLAKDQSLPKLYPGFKEQETAQQDMLKGDSAGKWRKVEL